MAESPLVSVLIPVFNGEQHVEEAVLSILEGTLSDLEVICIDDGSTDATWHVLQSLAARDPRVRAYSQSNRGVAATLNAAIRLARGRYVARMDHDDHALPQRLERQLQRMLLGDVDIIGASTVFFGEVETGGHRVYARHDDILMHMLVCSPLPHSTIFCKTSLIRAHGYRPTQENAEDYDLWVRLARAKAVFAGIEEPLVRYRWHAAQASQVHRERQAALAREIESTYRAWLHVPHGLFSPEPALSPISYLGAVLHMAAGFSARGLLPSRGCWRQVLRVTPYYSSWHGRILRQLSHRLGYAWLVLGAFLRAR